MRSSHARGVDDKASDDIAVFQECGDAAKMEGRVGRNLVFGYGIQLDRGGGERYN